MNIRILTLLVLSATFYQAYAMDGGLTAENMGSDNSIWKSLTQPMGTWFEQAQLDDETIKGGIPGIRYLIHFHGGKCIIAGTVMIGGYLLCRYYKNNRQTQEKREQEEESAKKTDERATQFPKKELKTTTAKLLRYMSAQLSALSHLIK